MPQSLAQVLVHLIFNTKNRERFLLDDIRPELHPYMATILKGRESPAILINSMEDQGWPLWAEVRGTRGGKPAPSCRDIRFNADIHVLAGFNHVRLEAYAANPFYLL